MRKVLCRSAIIGLVAIAMASVSACSGVSGVVAGNGTPPQNSQPHVVTRSHTATVTGGFNLPLAEISQPCDVNEGVVGGGYLTEKLRSPIESRPSTNGWVVTFFPPQNEYDSFSVTIYAECLEAGVNRVSIQSVSHDFPKQTRATVVAQCPTGSTAVGGGYAMRPGIDVDEFLYALGGGNFSNMSTQDVIAGATAYVICYSSPVKVSVLRAHDGAQGNGSIQVTNSNGQTDYKAYYYVDYHNTCSGGWSMTTGGYASPRGAADINGPNSEGKGWQIELTAPGYLPTSVGDLPYAEFACAAF